MGADLTAEDTNFNKGKGKTLAAMLLLAAAAVGGFVFYLLSEQPNPYGELGKQINGLRSKHFDAFMMCVVPGTRLDLIKSDRDLRTEVHGRAKGGGVRYAEHLRNECAPKLASLSSELSALLPPEDADAPMRELASAAGDLRRATLDFSDYVTALEGPYDEESAEPQIEPMARAWYEFRKIHAELNKQIRAALER